MDEKNLKRTLKRGEKILVRSRKSEEEIDFKTKREGKAEQKISSQGKVTMPHVSARLKQKISAGGRSCFMKR